MTRALHNGAATVALASALAACANSAAPTANRACVDPLPPQTQLVYPQASATGVPDAVSVLVYASTMTRTIQLVNGVTPPVTTVATAVPAPLPSPAASAPPGESLFAVSFGMLDVGTPYVVQVVELGGCLGGTIGLSVGSFTTQ